MTIKYIPTTPDISADDKPTIVTISDGEYMLYELLTQLINTMKKRKG